MSDCEIRSTVLHEMCHHASRDNRGLGGHGPRFFAELEGLLRRGAPVSIGFPETGGLNFLAGIVPARFPLCRALMDKAERSRARHIVRIWKACPAPVQTINLGHIVGEVEDAVGIEGLMPKAVVTVVSMEYGLIKIDGTPVSRWAARVLKEAWKAARRTRREFLVMRRAEERMKSLKPITELDVVSSRFEAADRKNGASQAQLQN